MSLLVGLWLVGGGGAQAQLPVWGRSDVVFMYQASRPVYEEYGATVLAWGGRPTPKSLAEAQGLKFFGSVGMVTEFNRYYERFSQSYTQGLCRDFEGRPFKVPWLTDHQHKGVPYWWCCTRQPLFRQFITERVTDTLKAGAHGVHIDDHLGTAGALGSGGCFCDRCVPEFREYLAALPAEERAALGVTAPAAFDYRAALRAWLAEQPERKPHNHPLWPHWRIYQFRGAAQFMEELRALAARAAGRPVPLTANACLLWGPHLSDYRALDGFSAEIEHHAPARRLDDGPLVAYRLADAVGRPLAATAGGGDWAFVKEHNLPGLVQSWIAFSYAAGHGLMAPHRQWCHTPQKGTHWYDGPRDKFAPLCQFVRRNAALFDDYRTHADLTVAFAQRTFDRNAGKVMDTCRKLSAAGLSFRIALGGDAIVDHPLRAEDIDGRQPLLVLEPTDFLPADQRVLAAAAPTRRLASLERALAEVKPAVQTDRQDRQRVLPRVKPGGAVLHLVNWRYEPAQDTVERAQNVTLKLDLEALGVANTSTATLFAPGAEPRPLPIRDRTVTVPELGLWAVVELKAP